MKIALGLLLVIAGCSGSSNDAYPGRPAPMVGQWTGYGSGTGLIGPLNNPFDIPAQASNKTVNYVYTVPPGSVAVGHTMTVNYSVNGYGALAPLPESNCGEGGCGPALLRLFIWNKNKDTSQDRWWCVTTGSLVMGNNQTLSCAIDPAIWTGVMGQTANGNNFFPGDIFAVGFTFGGMFAGHGVWATSGAVQFKIEGFAVQ